MLVARTGVIGGIATVVVMLVALPAAGQLAPTPVDCEADPTAVECRDGEDSSGGEGSQSDSEQACSFGETQVPCSTAFGFWVGDAVDGHWYIHGDEWPVILVGCWATATAADQDPPTTYTGEADTGAWYTLSCLGPGGSWPTPGPTQFQLAWTPDGVAPPDPEELARRALATITLRAPGMVLSPPETGSVPLGMPLWLALAEDADTWGPISSGPFCDQGLCVEVTATVAHVDWTLGDGAQLRCTRAQNTQWQPARDFLTPGQACHHYYTEPSDGQDGAGFTVSAATSWRAEWSGGGQAGEFVGLAEVCGAAGDEPCQATASVRVEEIHVVGTR